MLKRSNFQLAGTALLTLGSFNLYAATIQVTTTDADSSYRCNLYDAVLSAETDQAIGGCSAGLGPDEIIIGAGSYPLYNRAEENGGAALPVVTTAIKITATDTIIRRRDDAESSPQATILQVGDGGTLTGGGFTLDTGWGTGLVIDKGVAELNNVTVTNQSLGGIAVINGGKLTLTDSEVSENSDGLLMTTGGIKIFNGATLELYNSIIRNNDGGIGRGYTNIEEGTLNTIYIENSDIIDNYSRNTSGIDASTARLTLINSSVTGNSARSAPGIESSDSETLITDSIIANNRTTFGTAAGISTGKLTKIINTIIHNNECDVCDTGGIHATGGTQIENSTIINNSGYITGGIITQGLVTISNSTIAGNTVTPPIEDPEKQHRFAGGIASKLDANTSGEHITLKNTIIANNTGGHWQCAEDLTAESGSNFVGDGSCNATYSNDNPFDDANINTESAQHWPLNNTHIAATGGDINSCTKTDAIQIERLTDGNCSLGALEASPAETTSAETTSAETTSTETTSTETTSTETTSTETTSTETTSAETTSAETTSAETTSAETTSAETTSAETTSAETTSNETNNTTSETSSEEINANDGNAVLTDSNDRVVTNVNTSINGGAGALGLLAFLLLGLTSFSRQRLLLTRN